MQLCESRLYKKLMSNDCTSLLRRRACVTNQFSLFVLCFFLFFFVGRCLAVCLCTWLWIREHSQSTHTHTRTRIAHTQNPIFFLCSLLVIKTDATKRVRLLAQRAPGLLQTKKNLFTNRHMK